MAAAFLIITPTFKVAGIGNGNNHTCIHMYFIQLYMYIASYSIAWIGFFVYVLENW